MKTTKLLRQLAIGCGTLLAICALGCKSASQYVSPRIEGRVVDANSHQPIKGVLVKRLGATEEPATSGPAKGGAMMVRPQGVRSSATGQFVLESVKDLAVFRQVTWYSVSLSFEHSSYKPFTAAYTLLLATNSTGGEPTISAGDIPLVPRSQ